MNESVIRSRSSYFYLLVSVWIPRDDRMRRVGRKRYCLSLGLGLGCGPGDDRDETGRKEEMGDRKSEEVVGRRMRSWR